MVFKAVNVTIIFKNNLKKCCILIHYKQSHTKKNLTFATFVLLQTRDTLIVMQ